MGTSVMVLLPAPQAVTGAATVRALFAEWELRLSRFLPRSELSRLNRRAGESVRVSDLLYRVLTTALAAAQATEGLYDPTLLRHIEAAGYDRSFDEMSSPVSLTPAPPHAPHAPSGGWRQIRVDRAERRVMLPPGVGLDFGGIAKGMAVDAAIERLRQLGVRTALVNAGGDLAVLGRPPHMEDWPIAVAGRDASWTVPLRRGALATSGIARRHWWQGDRLRHHLLDPRTGDPAESGLWSVTVSAERCEQAEVAAKVAFLLGPERGAAFLHTHQLAGMLVSTTGSYSAVAPWPRHLMRPAPMREGYA
ncbi:MAG: FAD:protein FMN transferase [Ktedonobacterales bacterium]